MTPTIKLTKNIIFDDPRNLVCYVTLTVTSSSDIPKDIFVVKYTPPVSAVDPGSKVFYNVAYVDQLEELSTTPSRRYEPCFLLSNTVTKSFSDKKSAESWCLAIYEEIQRLISTYTLSQDAGITKAVDITEFGYKESDIKDSIDMVVDPDMLIGVESSLSSESSSSSSVEDTPIEPEGGNEITHDTIELTFDGKEIII